MTEKGPQKVFKQILKSIETKTIDMQTKSDMVGNYTFVLFAVSSLFTIGCSILSSFPGILQTRDFRKVEFPYVFIIIKTQEKSQNTSVILLSAGT